MPLSRPYLKQRRHGAVLQKAPTNYLTVTKLNSSLLFISPSVRLSDQRDLASGVCFGTAHGDGGNKPFLLLGSASNPCHLFRCRDKSIPSMGLLASEAPPATVKPALEN